MFGLLTTPRKGSIVHRPTKERKHICTTLTKTPACAAQALAREYPLITRKVRIHRMHTRACRLLGSTRGPTMRRRPQVRQRTPTATGAYSFKRRSEIRNGISRMPGHPRYMLALCAAQSKASTVPQVRPPTFRSPRNLLRADPLSISSIYTHPSISLLPMQHTADYPSGLKRRVGPPLPSVPASSIAAAGLPSCGVPHIHFTCVHLELPSNRFIGSPLYSINSALAILFPGSFSIHF